MSTTDPTLTLIRNTCTAIAVALGVTRSVALAGFLHMPDWSIAASMVLFVITVPAAAWAAYQLRIRRILAEKQAAIAEKHAAEQRAVAAETRVVQLSEAVLSEEEDRALWDSIPAATSVEDTCAFGLKVVPINQYRGYPQAG
ncbi:hypothetical protein [Micromonospora sp. L32]|uniref:hypothetical protein n=1 Tax=Micromonospora sp. L32 TaxID=3452214 RepID=UPI003F8A01B5